jgi:hypothetical protein
MAKCFDCIDDCRKKRQKRKANQEEPSVRLRRRRRSSSSDVSVVTPSAPATPSRTERIYESLRSTFKKPYSGVQSQLHNVSFNPDPMEEIDVEEKPVWKLVKQNQRIRLMSSNTGVTAYYNNVTGLCTDEKGNVINFPQPDEAKRNIFREKIQNLPPPPLVKMNGQLFSPTFPDVMYSEELNILVFKDNRRPADGFHNDFLTRSMRRNRPFSQELLDDQPPIMDKLV